MRKFSLILSFKSKSAYKYVRGKFSGRLPALRTLRSWHSKSSENVPYGFINQTLLTLTKLANEKRGNGEQLYISMCFDEIAIRKHIQYIHTRKCFSGMINYGRRDDDEIPVANYSIFFLINLIESGQSLILGYFLIKTLNSIEKSRLIQTAIEKIDTTGACLMSIAFDGLVTNFSTFELLGASFDIQNLQPFIINPTNNQKICIVLDPPHMLKLVRNCLGAKGHLRDGNNNDVAWEYFVNLVNTKTDLASHKMTREHIEFNSNKMNVKLAAQTLLRLQMQ